MGLTVVPGVVATLNDIGQDETWLRDWLRERPARLGLGQLHLIEDPAAEDDAIGFLAGDESRVLSVAVCLGELEAADAFGVLQGWASSRAHAPEKDHVAVLVSESLPERYRVTLEALGERLPLVVVGLSVWRGESEAIIVPHVTLASDALDLSGAPAAAAASAMETVPGESGAVAPTLEATPASTASADTSTSDESAAGESGESGEGAPLAATHGVEPTNDDGTKSPESAEQKPDEDGGPLARLGRRDDTGVNDPWRLVRNSSESGLLKSSYTPVASR